MTGSVPIRRMPSSPTISVESLTFRAWSSQNVMPKIEAKKPASGGQADEKVALDRIAGSVGTSASSIFTTRAGAPARLQAPGSPLPILAGYGLGLLDVVL